MLHGGFLDFRDEKWPRTVGREYDIKVTLRRSIRDMTEARAVARERVLAGIEAVGANAAHVAYFII
jgi:hypothetical protein